MTRLTLGLITVVALTGTPIEAQLLTNPVQDYINKTTLLNNILSNARTMAMSQKAQTEAKSAGSRAGSGAAPEPTKFTHTGGFVLPKLLAEKSPAGQREAEQFFSSLVSLYEETARKDGFPSHDLAYALEYFVVNSYLTYHDLHDVEYDKDPRVKRGKDMFERLTIINEKKLLKVTLDQERAIYHQFKNLLAANQGVREMTDRQKQEVTELLAITFGVNYRAYMKGVNSGDERLVEQARQIAKEHLEKLTGVPIERIKIRHDGLQL